MEERIRALEDFTQIATVLATEMEASQRSMEARERRMEEHQRQMEGPATDGARRPNSVLKNRSDEGTS